MLDLIYGTSGSGKTKLVLDAICRDIQNRKKCYLLIPEQQAYISERDLAVRLPQNAGLYFEIVNFSKLTDHIFRKYGGAAQINGGNGIRLVLMWETMRQLSPVLLQYGKSRTDVAITSEMLATLQELQNNGIDSTSLESVAAQLDETAPLRKKLLDLAVIDAAYREKAAQHCGMGISDRLINAAQILEKHDFFDGCNVYIDSFTSFTAPEYAFLREILRQADGLTVTLCTDQLFSKQLHFENVSYTAQRLIRMAKDLDAEIVQTNVRPNESDKPAELKILERGLWNLGLTKQTREPSPKDTPAVIHTSVCSNLYEESEACAIQILGLIQNGMNYGDVAVVVRDTETYRGVLDAAFERYGIPYFLSERTDLSSKPLSRLILSALRAISQNYRTQDVLTLLKTDISGADTRDVALFEEYCETWHITGKRFFDQVWSMNPDGLTEQKTPRGNEILLAANRVRQILMEPLSALHSEMRVSKKAPDLCRAVYRYLCRLNVQEQLSRQAKNELTLGQHRQAGETLRLYDFIVETLVELSTLLNDSEMTIEEFLSVLTLYFSVTDLGSVPNVHDCVVIGSANTLRLERVKASFLLGLCEGEFPGTVTDSGLLTESDKSTLEAFGFSVDSRQKLRSSEELFYVYRAMTKPSEQLFLSYPSMQPDGSQRSPSLAFQRIEFLFDRKPKTVFSEYLHPKTENALEEVQPIHRLPDMGANVRLHLSQSSIQAFALCPYRYYSTYRLKLRSKKDSNVSAADEGNFLHFVFENFLKKSLNEDGSLSLPSFEELPHVADDTIHEYLERVCPIPPEEMDNRLLHLFERLRGLAILVLREIVGELSCSQFKPVGFEQRLGGAESNSLPAVRLTLRDGCAVELHGVVDRVDVFEKEGKLYVRIVDYKTGEHKFSFDKVRSGEDLQLVLYLFAVVSSAPERYVPVGGQFLYTTVEKGKTSVSRSGFLLNDEEIRQAADGTQEQGHLKNLIKSTSEELDEITNAMQETVRSIAERILSGEAQKTPSEDACRFCGIRDHCDVACHAKK